VSESERWQEERKRDERGGSFESGHFCDEGGDGRRWSERRRNKEQEKRWLASRFAVLLSTSETL